MSIDPASESASIPLWLRAILIPLAAVVLFVFFVFLGFPYHDLADSLSRQIEQASGVTLRFDDVSPHLGLFGPGLAASGVTATTRDGLTIDIDDAVVRPAWSLSWFSLEPAIHLDLERAESSIRGTLIVSQEPAWDGAVEGLDLDLLPIDSLLPGGSLDGTLSAEADLQMLQDGLAGTLVFNLADGSVGLPGSPFGVPFEVVEGDIVFGGELFAQVNQLDLDGPMLQAQADGSIGKAARRGDEALDMSVDIKVTDNNLKGVVRGMGIRVAGDGVAKIRVTGPLSKPQVIKGS